MAMPPIGYFNDDEMMYRVRFEPLPRAVESISALIQSSRKKCPAAFVLGDNPVTICVGQADTVCAIPLQEITIKTWFVTSNGVMMPCFQDGRNYVRNDAVWKCPPSMSLTFAISCKHNGILWRLHEGYLYAVKKDLPGFWRLPLANTYADGRLCLGEGVRISGATLPEVCEKSAAHLRDSVWNADMLPELAKTYSLFRFDPSTKEPMAVPESWEIYCHRCSRVEMEELS